MRSNRFKAALFAVLLFGLGCAVGVLGQRYMSAVEVNAKTAEDMRQKYVTEMQTRLNLTSHQVDKLQVILDDTKAKIQKVRASYHPQMVEIKGEQVKRVKEILTPDQSKQYDVLVAERERKGREQDEKDRHEDQLRRVKNQKALAGK